MTRPLRLLIAFFVLCTPGLALSQVASLRYLDKVPESGIYNEDRVDLSWGYQDAVPDSVVLDLHDGTKITLPGQTTHFRHVYKRAGIHDLTLTCWTGGVSSVTTRDRFVDVGQRTIPGDNVMFVHHSTGRYMMRDSGVRSLIDQHNAQEGTKIKLWDHDYHSGNSYTGIIRPDSSVYSDWSYGIEANNIQPDGYQEIFSGSAFRDSLFARHDVIIMKNDHATGDIADASKMVQHMTYYIAIRDILDQYPDKLFIFMSGPPRRPEAISNANADYARIFYDWMQGPYFMNGHPNIMFFDLFDLLAYPNDPEDSERNMLRAEYRLLPQGSTDSHPNTLANLTNRSPVRRLRDPRPSTRLLSDHRRVDDDAFGALPAGQRSQSLQSPHVDPLRAGGARHDVPRRL